MTKVEIGTDTSRTVYAEITEVSDGGKHGYRITHGQDLVLALDGAWISRDHNKMRHSPEDTIWTDLDKAMDAARATCR
jgi:hypothetical protein